MKDKKDIWQGTLAIMALKTLDVMGPQHGYGIARRIEQISGDLLSVNHGTLYPVLLKLEQEGCIKSEWGESESGRKELDAAAMHWRETTEIIARFFAAQGESR